MPDIVIILGIVLSYIAAFYAAKGLINSPIYHDIEHRSGRVNVLDGVRGYLALGVFIHNGIMYFYYLGSGDYARLIQDYVENLGKVSVAIFFIITGFLFTSKLLKLGDNINWYSVYKSRVFRLVPLYLFAVIVISLVVVYETNATLQVSHNELFKDYIKWALFHGDKINGYESTGMVISGVDWSLKYEWLFYLSLPFVAILLRLNSMISFAFVGVISLLGSIYPDYYFTFNSRYLLVFFIGGLVAKAQHKSNKTFPKSRLGQIIFMSLVAASMAYNKTLDTLHMIICGLMFYCLISGFSRFNIFSNKASAILGEISYSIYLLHGMILYGLFYTHNTFSWLATMPKSYFLVIIPSISVLVVIISHLTYRFIERPGLALAKSTLFNTNQVTVILHSANDRRK